MDEPVYMLNALWFKAQGGKEKYQEYAAAAEPFLAEAGAKVCEKYTPDKQLIGEWNPDVFFVVRYPSKAAFAKMANSPEYEKILRLREEALEKSLLIRCKEFDWQ